MTEEEFFPKDEVEVSILFCPRPPEKNKLTYVLTVLICNDHISLQLFSLKPLFVRFFELHDAN